LLNRKMNWFPTLIITHLKKFRKQNVKSIINGSVDSMSMQYTSRV